MDTAGDGVSDFFKNGNGFMTSYIAGSRRLTVVTWSVSPSGIISFVARTQTGGKVEAQALSATTSIVTLTDDEDKFVKVIKWQVSDDGTSIMRPWNEEPGFQAMAVAASGNVIGAFVQQAPPYHLKVINWVALNP